MGSKYYAVRDGRSPGVYDNWSDCKNQVDGYSGNQYKSFSSLREAQDYAQSGHGRQVGGYSGSGAQDVIQTGLGSQNPYYLEFDGASKGNPGRSGAGVVLRNPDGSVACKIREGLGKATNNEAEYRALNRGLKYARDQGIDRIHVRGDSELVIKQVKGDWKTRAENIADLSREAKDLSSGFKEFDIAHVPRASNSEADSLANEGIRLPDGKWVSS